MWRGLLRLRRRGRRRQGRIRRPDRYRGGVEVQLHSEARTAKGPHSDQRALEMGIREGHDVLEGKAQSEFQPVELSGKGRDVADQPKVCLPGRHALPYAEDGGDREGPRNASGIRVEAGGDQVRPPGERFAPVARVQEPVPDRGTGGRCCQPWFAENHRNDRDPLLDGRRSRLIDPALEGEAGEEQRQDPPPAKVPTALIRGCWPEIEFIHGRLDTADEKLLSLQTAAQAFLVQLHSRSSKTEPLSTLVGDPLSGVFPDQLRVLRLESLPGFFPQAHRFCWRDGDGRLLCVWMARHCLLSVGTTPGAGISLGNTAAEDSSAGAAYFTRPGPGR